MFSLLPVKKNVSLEFDHFPTEIHAFVFRCWETISAKKMAEVLETTEENVVALAERMGLKAQPDIDIWKNRGYITIIKSVWHILPYEQIFKLLDWNEERLAYILKEDDFLDVKLGLFKPECTPVLWRDFSIDELDAEKRIKKSVEISEIYAEKENDAEPFDFFKNKYQNIKNNETEETVIDNSWYIQDLTFDDNVKIYAEDFKAEIRSLFGISLGETGENPIILSIIENFDNKNEEYHEIDVKKDKIEIRGAAPIGIFRGLSYILELSEIHNTFSLKCAAYNRNPVFKTRFIYSFCGLYADVLDRDLEISFPENLLKQYAKCGINGIWIQAVLYKLAKMPFNPNLSKGYETRVKKLKELTEKCARYGIKIYLYLNEPRCMPKAFFKNNPEIKGQEYDEEHVCLCTMTEKVRNYLKDSIKSIIEAAPLLGGFFNISVSENKTHCCSHFYEVDKINCPVCSKLSPAAVTAETVSVMADAAAEISEKIGREIKFFAYSWTWQKAFCDDEVKEILSRLSKNAVILNVSEDKMEFEKSGIKGNVIDYALSMPGPSKWSRWLWREAKKNGLECAAKVQINNSWECSTAPYLPVYKTVSKHMQNLIECGVEHIMLSWTLGGYPSDNIKIASAYFFEDSSDKESSYNNVLKRRYGEYAETVKNAAESFSNAFAEFPFSVETLYTGPQNLGAANLIFPKETGFGATMTCFPYDDLEYWRGIYPKEIFLKQFEKLCVKWEEGMKIIKDMPLCEFKDMAEYGYTLFKSSYNQIKYYVENRKENDIDFFNEEKKLAKKAIFIMKRNSAVGYEAANHYYVSKHMLLEKIIQCDYLIEKDL